MTKRAPSKPRKARPARHGRAVVTTREAKRAAKKVAEVGAKALEDIRTEIKLLMAAGLFDVRGEAGMLEKRVSTLEDETQHHQKIFTEISVSLKDLNAAVDTIRADMRVINANSANAMRAIEAAISIKEALSRIEKAMAAA